MIGKLMICSLAVAMVMCLLSQHASGNEFEGCFTGLVPKMGRTFVFPANINTDCSRHCGERGYILAATQQRRCHCTLVFPENKVGDPIYGNATGPGSPCNMPCAGVLQTGKCEEDECCGGTEAYSVYATGGIDLIDQIKRRIMRSLKTREFTWLREQSKKNCTGQFRETDATNGYTLLQVSDKYSLHVRNTIGRQACEKACRDMEKCMSYTYNMVSQTCFANSIPSNLALTLPTSVPTVVADRICSDTIKIVNTLFDLDLKDFKRLMHEGLKTDRKPLYNEDFELDLTNSNYYDSLRRTITMSNSEETQFSTQSGFERGKTKSYSTEYGSSSSSSETQDHTESRGSTHGLETSQSQSNSETRGTEKGQTSGTSQNWNKNTETSKNSQKTSERSNTEGQTDTTGYHISASVSATAGFNVGFASGSVTATVEGGFNSELARTTQNTWGQTDSYGSTDTSGYSQGGSSENQRTSSDSYSRGRESTSGRSQSDTSSAEESWRASQTRERQNSYGRSASHTGSDSHMFNNGYHKSMRSETSQTYEFSLTVPPLHRGIINFFVEEGPQILKWRSSILLNGIIHLQVLDYVLHIHVSRILTKKEREFFTLGTVVYKRKVIVGKTTILDRNGKMVKTDEQVVGGGPARKPHGSDTATNPPPGDYYNYDDAY